MNAQTFARALTKRLAEPPLARIVLRQARIGYCPACGTSVRADDVLGVIGWHVAHAECSRVHARAQRHQRQLEGAHGGPDSVDA